MVNGPSEWVYWNFCRIQSLEVYLGKKGGVSHHDVFYRPVG